MSAVMAVAMGALGIAGALTVLRMVRSGSVVDRIVALDTLVVVLVSGLAVQAAGTGVGTYLDAAVVLGLLGFAGTTLMARLLERGTR